MCVLFIIPINYTGMSCGTNQIMCILTSTGAMGCATVGNGVVECNGGEDEPQLPQCGQLKRLLHLSI